jgi:beta-lactamase regulating signal transducer with metallopeptidase domain
MTALIASAFANAAVLGIGATGFLWLVLRIIPRSAINAATRYGIWWIALLITVALPFAFLSPLNFQTPRPASLGTLPVQSLTMAAESAPPQLSGIPPRSVNSSVATPSVSAEARQPVEPSAWKRFFSERSRFPWKVRAGLWLNFALAVWLLSTSVLIIRLIVSYLALRQRCLRATRITDDQYRSAQRWADVQKTANRTVRVSISNEIDTPLAIGFRKPEILIPESFLTEFEEADLERICVHEVAHLNRLDDVTLLFQRAIEAVLPWHPAVWWISRQLDFEREASCDDWAVAATGQYKDYALCLTRVAELGGALDAVLTTPTVVGLRSDLSRRIDSLLCQRNKVIPQVFRLRLLALALLFTGVVVAAGRAGATVAFREPPQSRNAQIQQIIDDVPSAPPELGADILLKLVERGDITDPKLKRQILDDAWDLARKARYPTEIGNPIGVMVESDAGSLVSSLPGLTTAAIQLRVITQVAPMDSRASRELFLEMKSPEPESLGCSASRYSSHSSYFKALGIALGTFSDEEVQRGKRTQFLKNNLRSLTNQTDLQLSLSLITEGKFPDKDTSELLDQWSETLSNAHFSDRQFFIISYLFKMTLTAAESEQARGHSPENLLRALRSYFVRHAGAVRCEDGSWRPFPLGPDVRATNNEEDARLMFNSKVSDLGLSIPPIKPEEIKPAGFAGKAEIANYLSVDPTDKVWQIMLAGKHLRFGTPEQAALNKKNSGAKNVAAWLTLEQRSTPAWNNEALQHLTQLESWTRDLGREDREVFVLKAEFYSGLLELTPDGKLHDTVMKSYVNFLVHSPMKVESPPEWAWWGIQKLIRSDIVADKHKWLDEIEDAGDTTISLYTRLARLNLDRNPAVPH